MPGKEELFSDLDAPLIPSANSKGTVAGQEEVEVFTVTGHPKPTRIYELRLYQRAALRKDRRSDGRGKYLR
jgi:hypothetical protein